MCKMVSNVNGLILDFKIKQQKFDTFQIASSEIKVINKICFQFSGFYVLASEKNNFIYIPDFHSVLGSADCRDRSVLC